MPNFTSWQGKTDPYLRLRQQLNAVRYRKGNKVGHYESYFIRANHPEKPLAFWIRYTIFSPKINSINKSRKTIGELWAIVFDRKTNLICAQKEEFPIDDCRFSRTGLDIKIADRGSLVPGHAIGKLGQGNHQIEWDLQYSPGQAPTYLLPTNLYAGKFPAAKALCANPLATFSGTLKARGHHYSIESWLGSENHNWGSRNTDEYAWGQVAGFDNDPTAYLECATARVKVGPFQTPWMTTVVMRFDGREFAITSFWKAIKARAEYKCFIWSFDTHDKNVRIHGTIEAPLEDFIGLNYYNPPGGSSSCLNSKISRCKVTVSEAGKADRVFITRNRAAFEIFNADDDHGVLFIG